MKSKEEIEQLAKEEYKDNLHNPFFTAAPMGYIKGYIQCQEDMADKKYTEEDMIKFAKWLLKINFNYTSNIIDIFQIWKEELNKQE